MKAMAANRSILVTDLPINKGVSLLDKLEIYFSRRSNGGGDVDSIKMEMRNGQTGLSAVITFAEEETASSVLRMQHIFFGKKFEVHPHLPTTNGMAPEDTGEVDDELYMQDGTFTALPENLDNLSDSTVSEQIAKLVLDGQCSYALLKSVAASTTTKLGVDEKSARLTLTGRTSDVIQAAAKLGRCRNGSKIKPYYDDNGRNDEQQIGSQLARAFENLHLGNEHPIKDETSPNFGTFNNKQLKCKYLQTEMIQNSKEREKLPRPSKKMYKSPPSKAEIKLRNTAKFDQKILDYINIHIVSRQTVDAMRDKFIVNFKSKPGGLVEVSSNGPETNQQNIKNAIEALEDLVNQIEQLDLVTEIVDVRQFPDASREDLETATKQALKSTQVLVTRRAWNRLEFFGREYDVCQEIEMFREAVLDRRDTDEHNNKQQMTKGGGENQSPAQEFDEQDEKDVQARIEEETSALSEEQSDALLAPVQTNFEYIAEDVCSPGVNSCFVSTKTMLGLGEGFLVPCRPAERYLPPSLAEEGGLDSIGPQKVGGRNTVTALEIPMAMNWNLPPCEDVVETNDMSDDETAGNDQPCQTFVTPLYGDFVETDSPNFPQTREEGSEKMYDACGLQDYDQLYQRSVISGDGIFTEQHEVDAEASRALILMDHDRLLMDAQTTSSNQLVPLPTSPLAASLVSYTYIPPDKTDPARLNPTETPVDLNGVKRKIQKDSRVKYTQSPSDTTQDPVGEMATINPRGPHHNTVESDVSFERACQDVVNTAGPLHSSQSFFRSGRAESSPGQPLGRDFTTTLKTGMTVIIRQGDIVDEFTDVIVSSADSHLRLQNGVGRAVRDAAGPELVSACERWIQHHGPVQPGKSVWTTGGNLKCSHVLHVVPPRWDDQVKSKLEALKEMFVEALKTCSHSLKASAVSMPAIGSGTLASRKICANAFFDAVFDITNLYQQGWMRLDTIVLVDRDQRTVQECQEVFNNAILSGYLQELIQWKEIGPQTRSASSCTSDNPHNEFASAASGAIPRPRPKGPNRFSGKPHRKHPARSASRNVSRPHVVDGSSMGDLAPAPYRDNECSICLGEIKNVKKLRCGHRFCRVCVDTALKTHKYCPYCKQPVVP